MPDTTPQEEAARLAPAPTAATAAPSVRPDAALAPAGPANGLTDAEETELARLQAKAEAAAAGESPIRMRIESGHSEMTFGGFTLTQEFRPVPPHLAGPITTAAADAGVTIAQERD